MRVYIWGTGRLTGKVVGRCIGLDDIVAFIDSDASKKEYMGKTVLTPEEAAKQEYDAILVANLYREEIYDRCLQLGIDLQKVIFLYNNCFLTDINQDYGFVEKILGKEMAEIVRRRYHAVRGVDAYEKPFHSGQFAWGGTMRMTM